MYLNPRPNVIVSFFVTATAYTFKYLQLCTVSVYYVTGLQSHDSATI